MSIDSFLSGLPRPIKLILLLIVVIILLMVVFGNIGSVVQLVIPVVVVYGLYLVVQRLM